MLSEIKHRTVDLEVSTVSILNRIPSPSLFFFTAVYSAVLDISLRYRCAELTIATYAVREQHVCCPLIKPVRTTESCLLRKQLEHLVPQHASCMPAAVVSECHGGGPMPVLPDQVLDREGTKDSRPWDTKCPAGHCFGYRTLEQEAAYHQQCKKARTLL
jgi:hypothetical protein